MATATYTLALGIVVTAAFMMPPYRVDASDQQETNPAAAVDPMSARVRTEDSVLATLIRDATDRSQTFRQLVEAITPRMVWCMSCAVHVPAPSEPASRMEWWSPAQIESCG